MRKNMSQNWKAVIFYILIPVLLIGSIFLLSYQNKNTVTTNYSEIVNLFRNDKVENFELDLSTGELINLGMMIRPLINTTFPAYLIS